MKTTKKDYSQLPEISLQYKSSGFICEQIRNSEQARDIFKQLFDGSIEIYESMFAIYLNRANKTIGWMRISQGGLSGTIIDNRLLLKAGIESLTSGIIVCHNHPSGNENPSEADKKVTKKLSEACKILDMILLDHIIVTAGDNYFSFSDNGLI